MAARAIPRAADHGGRARWAGRAVIGTIVGERFAALLDRHPGRTGSEAQQTGEPKEPGGRDDVDGPVPCDRERPRPGSTAAASASA